MNLARSFRVCCHATWKKGRLSDVRFRPFLSMEAIMMGFVKGMSAKMADVVSQSFISKPAPDRVPGQMSGPLP